MEFEIGLKFLLSFSLGVLLLLSKKTKCNTDCFISTIILGIATTLSAIIINYSKNNNIFILFFGIIIAVFAINTLKENKNSIFPIEALILILISFAIGFDYYFLSFITVLITIISSFLISYIVDMTTNSSLSVFIISIEENASTVIDIKKILTDIGIKFKNIKLSKSKDGYEIELFISTSKNKKSAFIEKSMQLKGVVEMTSETF